MSETKTVKYLIFIAVLVSFLPWALAQISAPVSQPADAPVVVKSDSPVSAPATIKESLQTLWDLFMTAKGFMLVLGLTSVLALFLSLYYSLTITETRLIQREFLRKVYDLVNHGNFVDAGALCEKVDGFLPRILASGLRRREMGILAVSDAMSGVGGREMERLRQKIKYLADISALSPMIGLLGTVWGMIEAFRIFAFTEAGRLSPGDLAGSISKALVTTAAGLVIAIPSMAVYYYLRGRLVAIGTRLEERSAEFAERIIVARAPRGNVGDSAR